MSNELTQHLLLFLNQPLIHLNAAIECEFNHDDSYQTERLLMNVLRHMVQLCYDQDESLSGRIVYFPFFKSKIILQPTHHIPKALVDKNQTVFARFGSKNRTAINLGYCIYIMQNGIQIKTPHFNVKFKIHNGLFIRDL